VNKDKQKEQDSEIAGFTLGEAALNSRILTSITTGGRLWLHYNSPEELLSMLTCLSKVDELEVTGNNALHYSKEILNAIPGGYWSFNNAQVAGGFPLVKNFTLTNIAIQDNDGMVSVYSFN